jgi:hypothetical protein
MTPFPLDERPIFDFIETIPSPLGGDVVSSIPLNHRRIGQGWAGWSHGYNGDLYYTNETEIVLTLPPDTYAFYLSGSHNLGAAYTVYAHADDGETVGQLAHPFSAVNIGFYQDDPSAGPIETVTISCDTDFAIGEFGIAVPEPASAALLVAGLMVLKARRGHG